MKKKLLTTAALFLFGVNSHAAQPEIWWATRAQCNVFMGHLTIQLTEKGPMNENDEQSYVGQGKWNFESLDFPDCKSQGEDSILCHGRSNISQTGMKFLVTRNADGTFRGELSFGQDPQPLILGCVLSR